MMDPYLAGLIMGLLIGGCGGFMGLLVYQWVSERFSWRRRVDLDDGYMERLRSLDRHPSQR